MRRRVADTESFGHLPAFNETFGAASERGDELEDLVALGERVNSVSRTMGMALTSCTPPANDSP